MDEDYINSYVAATYIQEIFMKRRGESKSDFNLQNEAEFFRIQKELIEHKDEIKTDSDLSTFIDVLYAREYLIRHKDDYVPGRDYVGKYYDKLKSENNDVDYIINGLKTLINDVETGKLNHPEAYGIKKEANALKFVLELDKEKRQK
ncbi:hypothetical protein QTN25_010115 [Entamoeba marina]